MLFPIAQRPLFVAVVYFAASLYAGHALTIRLFFNSMPLPFLDKTLAVLGQIGANRTNLIQLESCIEQIVPFVGAGLSLEFGYPGRTRFLKEAAPRFGLSAEVEACLAAGKLEEAAEAIAGVYKRGFDDYLREVFDERKLNRPLATGAVRYLTRIAHGPVLTTNFDHVLEAAFEDAGKRFQHIFPGSRIQEASRAIQLNRRFLLKVHGDYSDSASRVLTLGEYTREYGSPDPHCVNLDLPLPRVLSQALGARPLLFLGCSLRGDRTTLVIAEIARKLPGTVHFALLSEAENTPDRLRQLYQWNICPLFFPVGKFEKIEQFLACVAEDDLLPSDASAKQTPPPPLATTNQPAP